MGNTDKGVSEERTKCWDNRPSTNHYLCYRRNKWTGKTATIKFYLTNTEAWRTRCTVTYYFFWQAEGSSLNHDRYCSWVQLDHVYTANKARIKIEYLIGHDQHERARKKTQTQEIFWLGLTTHLGSHVENQDFILFYALSVIDARTLWHVPCNKKTIYGQERVRTYSYTSFYRP